MELLDVVDENNQLIGKTEDRDIIHKNGLWHREIAVWIMNEKGEVLIQKRAATKKQAANKWALTAGHIDAGEEPIQVVKREVFEELGIQLTDDELEFIKIVKKQKEYPGKSAYNNCFTYVYFVKTKLKIEDYTIQEEELSEIKYVSIEEIERIVREKDDNYTFYNTPDMDELIEILKNKEENL